MDAVIKGDWHWVNGGATVFSTELVRLTHAVINTRGQLWCTTPVHYQDWEVIIEFRLRGDRYSGGDGFAFWYVKTPMDHGNTFGNADRFEGLGITMDTHKDKERGNFPMIAAIHNNGTQKYSHHNEGADMRLPRAFCLLNYRNTPNFARLKISYQHKTGLAVHHDVHGGREWKKCFEYSDLELPRGFFIGLTAQTGPYDPDAHDIGSVQFYGSSIAEDGEVMKDEVEDDDESMHHDDHSHHNHYDDDREKQDWEWLEPIATAIERWSSLDETEKSALKIARRMLLTEMRNVKSEYANQPQLDIQIDDNIDDDDNDEHSHGHGHGHHDDDVPLSPTAADCSRNETVELFVMDELAIIGDDMRDLQGNVQAVQRLFHDASHDIYLAMSTAISEGLNGQNAMEKLHAISLSANHNVVSALKIHTGTVAKLGTQVQNIGEDVRKLKQMIAAKNNVDDLHLRMEMLENELISATALLQQFIESDKSHKIAESEQFHTISVLTDETSSHLVKILIFLTLSQWIAVGVCVRLWRPKPQPLNRKLEWNPLRKRKPSLGTSSPA